MATTYYYECALCGYPMPFDPAHDIAEMKSGSYTVTCKDDVEVPTCKSIDDAIVHFEDHHPEVIAAMEDKDCEVTPAEILSAVLVLKATAEAV